MERTVDTREYLDMVCGLLEAGRHGVPVPVAGASMTPFFCHGDTVYLDCVPQTLHRGDIVLYRRPGGRYVLHRIVGIAHDGSLIMLGDAQTEREKIVRDAVCARAVRVLHKGKLHDERSLRWRFFAGVWTRIVPLRPAVVSAVTHIRRGHRPR